MNFGLSIFLHQWLCKKHNKLNKWKWMQIVSMLADFQVIKIDIIWVWVGLQNKLIWVTENSAWNLTNWWQHQVYCESPNWIANYWSHSWQHEVYSKSPNSITNYWRNWWQHQVYSELTNWTANYWRNWWEHQVFCELTNWTANYWSHSWQHQVYSELTNWIGNYWSHSWQHHVYSESPNWILFVCDLWLTKLDVIYVWFMVN